MIDHYKLLTLTFSDAQLDELAEYLITNADSARETELLRALKDALEVEELYYLHTCNRVLYLFYSNQPIAQLRKNLTGFLQAQSQGNPEMQDLKGYSGEDAVRHFFEVASSLQSMVLGEQEILRQVKEAYDHSWKAGLSGDQIRILFQSAQQTAKAVHNKTRISEKTVSVVSLAMKKLRRLGIHPEDEVVLIGAGDTMQKVARFLAEWGMQNVRVFNRSITNLLTLKDILPQVETYLIEEMTAHNLNVPFIISCTSHGDYVLTPEIVEKSTHGQGLTECRGILDLAVPRDVHPEIITKYGPKVIEVESLRTVAARNREFRKQEVKVASEILNQEMSSFREKVHRRFIERAFQEIPAKIYATRDKAVGEVFKTQIENLDPEGQKLVSDILDYMAEKCISIPMQTARKQYMAIRKDMSRNGAGSVKE